MMSALLALRARRHHPSAKRKPTDREQEKNLAYIQKVGNRAEAYEDILWALLNSHEFLFTR